MLDHTRRPGREQESDEVSQGHGARKLPADVKHRGTDGLYSRAAAGGELGHGDHDVEKEQANQVIEREEAGQHFRHGPLGVAFAEDH